MSKQMQTQAALSIFFFFLLDKCYLFLLSDVKFHLCNVWKESCYKNTE